MQKYKEKLKLQNFSSIKMDKAERYLEFIDYYRLNIWHTS